MQCAYKIYKRRKYNSLLRKCIFITILYKICMKKIIFVVLLSVMTIFSSLPCLANTRIESCGFGTYCISDALYQVEVPKELAPKVAVSKIYCTRNELNKKEPENNIIIMSGPTFYSTSMDDIEKFTEEMIKSIVYTNQMFNIVIDKYNTNVGTTKNGDVLISITTIAKNGLFEAKHFILTDYRHTIVSERCIDYSQKAELDENVQLVLDTFSFNK